MRAVALSVSSSAISAKEGFGILVTGPQPLEVEHSDPAQASQLDGRVGLTTPSMAEPISGISKRLGVDLPGDIDVLGSRVRRLGTRRCRRNRRPSARISLVRFDLCHLELLCCACACRVETASLRAARPDPVHLRLVVILGLSPTTTSTTNAPITAASRQQDRVSRLARNAPTKSPRAARLLTCNEKYRANKSQRRDQQRHQRLPPIRRRQLAGASARNAPGAGRRRPRGGGLALHHRT